MIGRLEIRDFRSIRHADLELGRMNVFLGPNAAGKSSILDALSVGLTGTCASAATGRGLADLAREGSPGWVIRVETEALGAPILRKGEGPRWARQAEIERELRVSSTLLRVALYGSTLLTEDDPKRLAAVFSGLVSAETVEIPEAYRSALSRILQREIGRAMTAEEIAAVAKELYEIRRELRALDPVPPTPPASFPEAAKETDRDRLESLVKTKRKLLSAMEASADRARREARELERVVKAKEREAKIARKEAESAERWLADALERLEVSPSPELRDTILELGNVRDRARIELDEIKTREAAVQSEAALEDDRALTLGGFISHLDESESGACPLCSTELGDRKTEVRAALEERARKHEKRSLELTDVLVEVGRERVAAEKRLAEIDAAFRLAETLVEKRADAEEASRELAGARTALAGREESSADELEAKVEALREQLRALEGYIAQRDAYERAVAAAKSIEAKREEITEILRGLVGPSGLVSGATSPIARIDREISGLLFDFGFEVDLSRASTGEILINERPSRLLSSSERLAVAAALQGAIAETTGAPAVAIDDLDRFVGPAAALAERMVRDIGSRVQVLAARSVRDVDAIESAAPKLARAGYRVFRVVGGKVELVAREEES